MTIKKDTSAPTWVQNLRSLMADQGYNPRSLSLRAGLNATAVRDMIEGRSRSPRYDTVQAMAAALNTTPARLMSDNDTGASLATKGDAFGKDVELLTEIIARLQLTAAEMKRNLTPREFAAMSATIYRKLYNAEDTGTRKSRLSAIKPHIDDLLEYETLRNKNAR